jgi:hypothetical protein
MEKNLEERTAILQLTFNRRFFSFRICKKPFDMNYNLQKNIRKIYFFQLFQCYLSKSNQNHKNLNIPYFLMRNV